MHSGKVNNKYYLSNSIAKNYNNIVNKIYISTNFNDIITNINIRLKTAGKDSTQTYALCTHMWDYVSSLTDFLKSFVLIR